MNEYDATECAYKNGYAKGYADAMRKAIYNLTSIGHHLEQIEMMLEDLRGEEDGKT